MLRSRKKTKKWLLLTSLIAINAQVSTGLFASPGKQTVSQVSNNVTSTSSLPSAEAFAPLIQDLEKRFPKQNINPLIVISASEQKLFLIENSQVINSYKISTAEAGLGSRSGSNKTPLGVHKVSQKYGKNAPLGAIFKARQNTKRVAKILTKPGARSNADNVTTRILWLSGMESGINKGGNVDSHARYIYIHGTDEEGRLGNPASHGCIRMANTAVVELFQRVPVGTVVSIIE